MSPSVTIDTTPDFDLSAAPAKPNGASRGSAQRTLLIAPPSISAHEEALHAVFETFDRAATDLQMLDRLAAGLVALPPATYDLVLLLSGAAADDDDENARLLGRDVLARLVPAMKAGGRLEARRGVAVPEREAVLAGLVRGDGGFVKPEYAEEEVVPLRFGKKTNGAATNGKTQSSPGPAVGSVTAPPAVKATPAGVGFIDLDDDLGDYESGDELIPEEDIMSLEEMNRPIQKPPACPPGRKKACADCTCGLAKRLQEEEKARRQKADEGLKTLKLDLEMDFTVQGKVGSCGSCSLGDAFRCADCPYIGLPPFKPGEEVRILNNIPQL